MRICLSMALRIDKASNYRQKQRVVNKYMKACKVIVKFGIFIKFIS